MSRRSELRLRGLALIVATKDYTRTSQQRGRNQRANHDWSSSAQALHARDKRGCMTKTTQCKCDGGNSDISSVHETTSSTGKTLLLMT